MNTASELKEIFETRKKLAILVTERNIGWTETSKMTTLKFNEVCEALTMKLNNYINTELTTICFIKDIDNGRILVGNTDPTLRDKNQNIPFFTVINEPDQQAKINNLKKNDYVQITCRILQINMDFSYEGQIYPKERLDQIINSDWTGHLKLQLLQIEKSKSTDGPCFIATLCYSNYNSIEVLKLRRFRDEKLLKTSVGRVLVKKYYQLSPLLVSLISKSDKSKYFIRKFILNPIVSMIDMEFHKRLDKK